MSVQRWRWEERDLGFRFRTGSGNARHDHYQGRVADEYYVVSAAESKLDAELVRRLAAAATVPPAPQVVANPWSDYHRDWDWIVADGDVLLNWAGCLDRSEIERREDEGVARAMEMAIELVTRDPPAPLDRKLVCELHVALMGVIYPFAGRWRRVALTKGDGPTKWPLPLGGIEPQMEDCEERVLARTPLLIDDDAKLFAFVAEMMGELLAIHPFREGNGRICFVLANLMLMQNRMLPLNFYDRKRDEERYYDACERSRLDGDHTSLAELLLEWSDEATARWEGEHAPSRRRVDLTAILGDPERRRRLMVSTIRATQAREGIETTPEQADRAYTVVTERERVACFKLAPAGGNPDRRHELFVAALGDGEGVRFDVARRDFEAIDGRPLAYEQLAQIAPLFREHPALEPAFGRARVGGQTGDDERYVRQWWEVAQSNTSPFAWKRFAKGGEFARFYSDVDLVVHWDPKRETFVDFFGRKGREIARPPAVDDFFRPGLTWPRRTQRGFNVRVLPEGCIFADKGPALFPKAEEDTGFLLGIVNSTLAEYMLRALTSFGSWEVGAVKRLPIPDPSPEMRSAIGEIATAIHDRKRRWDAGNETSTAFATPWLLDPEWAGVRAGLPARLESVLAVEADSETRLRRLYAELNDLVFALYRVGDAARRAIEESRAEAPPEVLWPQMERRSPEQKRMEHVWRLLSHAVRRAVDADQDGIVALADVSGEPSLAERVRDELAGLVLGADANRLETEIANELSRSVPGYRRVRGGIAEWLENCFFDHHVALYRSRPVLWHVTSAQGTAAAAFGSVVDYHRFDRDRMAKLRATYVRDAIETCRREAALADRANDPDQRLAWQERREEVEQLDDRLAAIQEGRVTGAHGGPGDLRILTPWKAPEARPRGWDPALDDGVKVNIAPFDRAGVLRVAGAGR